MTTLGSPQLWAACIAALAAVFAAYISFRFARDKHLDERRQGEVDFRRQQLNELYGPIFMRRQAILRVRKLLPWRLPDGSKWRLVDHISDVREAGGVSGDAVTEILRLNDEVEALLVSRAGLYTFSLRHGASVTS